VGENSLRHKKKGKMQKRLFIIGGGYFGRQCIDSIKANGGKVYGIFDNYLSITHKYFYDIPVMGSEDHVKDLDTKDTELVIAFGNGKKRDFLYNKFSNFSFPNVIDPKSHLAEKSKLGKGNVLLPFSFIESESTIGDFNIFDIFTVMGHGSNIGNFNHFACYTCLGGPNNVGDLNSFSVHSFTLPKLNIGNNITLGAMSFLNKDTKIPGIYVGVPAVKKEHKESIINENFDEH
jgi:sugar O-acyltransferase (sialic acid O-acetyltransferase NeuD family)